MLILEVTFWVAGGLIVYAMAGYPLLSLLLAATVRKAVDKAPITPRVSLIIAAYNEAQVIGRKLAQSLALDYPPENLEIIVASDGSTDGTDEIIRSFSKQGVVLFRAEGRLGKTAMVNQAVGVATGEILVFSDATGEYNAQCIRELAANFNDPSVGCVTGRVAYRYGTDATSRGFRVYQRIAVAVRRAESSFGSQTSVSGSIHAMRAHLYRPADPAFSLDVVDAVHTVVQGHRVVYENEAVSLEQARRSLADEFRCRVRISVRTTSMIPYVLHRLLSAGKLGYAFQMISHKVFRWWLWLFLLVALASCLMLAGHSHVYTTLAGLQGLFYLAGVLGLIAGRWNVSLPLVAPLSFFVMGNAAMCVGAFKRIVGVRMARWEPVR